MKEYYQQLSDNYKKLKDAYKKVLEEKKRRESIGYGLPYLKVLIDTSAEDVRKQLSS